MAKNLDTTNLSRRTLGAGAALGLILTAMDSARTQPLPIGVPSPNADAELFALQPEIEAADRLSDAAHRAQTVAEEAYYAAAPARPELPWSDSASFTSEEWFLTFKEKVAELRARQSPEEAARDQVLQAWENEDDRLEIDCGLRDARGRVSDAITTLDAVRDRLAAMRATTLAGLKFKAKYAAEHFPSEWDPDVMASIVDDILAMPEANIT